MSDEEEGLPVLAVLEVVGLVNKEECLAACRWMRT